MRLHPRTRAVEQAQSEFNLFLLKLTQKHALTYGELFSILGCALKDNAKYQIRAERHPHDPNKNGDEA